MTAAEQLADARRKLGLSLDDISSRTNISIKRLSAIECADPEKLPSFVALEDVIRAYATEVKLDPDAISDRYTSELLDPSSPMLSEHSFDSDIIPATDDAFAEFESEDDRADEIRPLSASGVVFVSPVERPTRAAEDSLGVAAPVIGADGRLTAPSKDRKSFSVLPLVLASTVAIVGGYLLSTNVGRLATRRGVDSSAVSASAPDPAASGRAPTSGPQTNADRAPAQPAHPGRASEPPRRRTDGRSQTSAEPGNSLHTSLSKAAGAGPQGERAVARVATGDPASRSAAPPVTHDPASSTTGATPGNADSVSGAWNITSKVESATLAAYKDLMLGFRLELLQRGDRIVGEGHKISENGTPLPARRKTPIKVEGTLEGNRLALDFTEVGARRASGGRFVLYLAEDGSFRGRFTSDAARSSGGTVAVRASPSGRN
jgi:cytoskeletal protein RodZ